MLSAMLLGLGKKERTVLLRFIALGLLCFLGCAPAVYVEPEPAYSGVDDVEYLSAYGEWIDVPSFGYVWRPFVVSDWQPFYYGHWVWTRDGWAWVSYEPYGWLVYHYGYWDYQPDIGWFWIPGDTWSPAQVEWYSTGDYAAWAPLPPPNVYWPEPWDSYENNMWIVVDANNFTDENIGQHRIRTPLQRDVIRREAPVTRPPDITRVRALSNRTIPTVKIQKRTINIHSQAGSAPTEQVVPSPTEPKLEKMVLPDQEERKVKKHAPEVKREVLVPQKTEQEEPQKEPEKKPEVERKKKTREE